MSTATMKPIRITPLIVADYERRGVFPELRSERGRSWGGRTSGCVYDISSTTLKQLWEDAYEEMDVRRGGRGEAAVSRAYNAFWKRLLKEIPYPKGRYYELRSGIPDYAEIETIITTAALFVKLGIPAPRQDRKNGT